MNPLDSTKLQPQAPLEDDEDDDDDEDYVPSEEDSDDDDMSDVVDDVEGGGEDDEDDAKPKKAASARKRRSSATVTRVSKRTKTGPVNESEAWIPRTRSLAAAEATRNPVKPSISNGNAKAEKSTSLTAAALNDEEARKKRLDDIWKSMNSASTPKAKPRPSLGATETKEVVQTYKFAGEEFSVTKTVKVNPETPTTTTSIQDITHPLSAAATSSSVSSSPLSSDSPSTPDATSTPSTSKKITQRKSVLQDIATRYGVGKAAAKLNTLDKSKLDWMKHVEAAGDGDRLKRHNKDGHLEKMDFLNRAHDRQLENIGYMKKISEKKNM